MSLEKYKKKRNFEKTNEPFPQKMAAAGQGQQRFVIQKHAASHLHYDFRLEMEDEDSKEIVLKSWSIPKNIPLEANQKHLAIETEDHPIEYIDFEGEIPPGNYGAGKVEIWDKGKWGLMKGSLKEGRISFNLLGEKQKEDLLWLGPRWERPRRAPLPNPKIIG